MQKMPNARHAWTVESRLDHMGYDFDPMLREIIGLMAKVNLLRALFAKGETPKLVKKGRVNVFYNDEVQYLDRAIGLALQDRDELATREQMRKYFESWGKRSGPEL